MPIGVLTDAAAVLCGGLFGHFIAKVIPKRIIDQLFLVIGISSTCIGINAFLGFSSMSTVILSVILGTVIGGIIGIDGGIRKGIDVVIHKIAKNSSFDQDALCTATALFCFSCTGIFGALIEGMQGDSAILVSKAVLDFFTACIFSAKIGPIIGVYAVPQALIFTFFFSIAKVLVPYLSPENIANFKAAGGIITIIISYNIIAGENGWKKVTVLDALPALIIAAIL